MATYYIDDATGDDTDTGLTEALAWKTINYAFSQISAGDKVWVKNTNDYTETVDIPDGHQGGYTNWITIEGYEASTGDGGIFTIDATGETYGITESVVFVATVYFVFRNMLITGAGSHGTANLGRATFINCEFSANGGDGANVNYSCFMSCEFSGNSGNGASGGRNHFAFCKVYSNVGGGSGGGIEGEGTTISYCEFYGNTNYSIYDDTTSGTTSVVGCTIDGNNSGSSYAVGFARADAPKTVINNIIYDSAQGLRAETVGGECVLAANNLLYSNTADYYQWPDHGKESDITGSAPGFTDEAGGDYTLAAGSAARNAGADASGTSSPGMDIGAHQSADAGGGGSRVIITG